MNKRLRYSLFFFTAFFVSSVSAQDFLGISTGNYAGVTGVMLQPASIVDSRHKFDINLFSFGTNFSNNYLQVDRRAITKFNSDNFEDYQTFRERYLSETNLDTADRAWFDVNTRVQLPLSFMATLNRKSAIALNIQNRSMVQGRNIRQPLARMAYNEFYYPPLNNQPIDASGFSLNTLNWLDVGLTYGHVLFSSDHHFLKGAVTAKYLGGVASLYMASNDLRLSVNNDSSINFNTSRFEYSRNDKADFNIFDRNLKPDANAFGLNAGLVYEFRGNINQLEYISRDDQKSYEIERRDVNKYMFRLGVSLLDVGVFNFDKAPTVNNVSGAATNWDLKNADYNSVRDFDTALNNRTTNLQDNPRDYKVHLPTALSVQLDIRFVKGLYLNAMAYRPLKLGSGGGYRFDDYGYYAITPRFESRHFGIYIPYTFTNHENIVDYKQNLLGATLRMGPLFIGSSNLGTMLFNKNLKAADVHAGIKVGITYGKPNKASMLIEKLTSSAKDTDARATKATQKAAATKRDTIVDSRSLPLLIDYSNGKVYNDPNKSGNIIIINNNTYYYSNITGKDSIVTERIIMNRGNNDSLIMVIDSSARARMMMKARSDSMQRVLRDSLNRKKVELDSMINRMQRLRDEMDRSSSLNNRSDTRKPGRDTIAGSQRSRSASNNLRDTARQTTAANAIEDFEELREDSTVATTGDPKKKMPLRIAFNC